MRILLVNVPHPSIDSHVALAVLLWFKFTEMVLQCWPRAILRVYFQRDASAPCDALVHADGAQGVAL
jgi:hypothetical protein